MYIKDTVDNIYLYIPSPFLFKVNSNQKPFRNPLGELAAGPNALLKVNSNQKPFKNPLEVLAARPIALNPPHMAPLRTGARWARVGGALIRVILDHPALLLLVILGRARP